ncbi:1,2-dihydroxy-3-keto-5-methylthiopentene dioxygenase [Galendromus occidentalis]|uniref:Acireductone dioxygenase n=1 Tax=Galendromus occidentalis TaxID=34638 RepID=A0AAJ6QMI0_9ACAR|nr:1,2-dihydroxy-3-keto-5-methylthiopentene dioxygenase [Galendromus occidentalis]
MVRAYYMNESAEDQRLPNELSPPRPIDLDQLYRRTGVMYFKIDESDWSGESTEGKLGEISSTRGYTYKDVCEISREMLGADYDSKMKIFFKEHLHADEEIRLIQDGSGYFDVRDSSDAWIRIHVSKGDLLIVPAGIYHRFTLDTNDYVKAMRLFVGEPVWTPINRPADEHDARKEYLDNLKNKFERGVPA